VAGKWGSILNRWALVIAIHPRQVQQHSEAGTSFHESAYCGAAKTKNEVAFPMTRYSPISNLGRAVADHDGIPDEGLVATSGPFARHAQCST
jgi:hypothetical protein